MPRTASLQLQVHPNLQAAFAKLYPTVESFLAAQEFLTVPEDTGDLQFTQQAEEALLDHIKDHLAPQPVNGLALQDVVVTKSRILTTGCSSIDELLLSGVREGQMTEIAGGPATGKTQLCLQLAAVTAWRGEKVIYIDTDKAFSARRVLEIGKSRSSSVGQEAQDSSGHLGNITVHECHTLHCLLSIVAQIDATMQACQDTAKTSLLVVDSVAALIPGILNMKKSMQGHCLMVQTSLTLKQLAERHQLAVILTNYTVAGQNESIKAAMGESWRVQPHTRLIFTRQERGAEGPEWSASLAASQVSKCGNRAKFIIDASGIRMLA